MTAISARNAALALAVGGLGYGAAHLANAPAPALLGSAAAVSVAALAGAPVGIPNRLRNGFLVVLGVGVGSGFDPQAGAALMRWPLGFAALFGVTVFAMVLSTWVLARGFGFSRRGAMLAGAPGHLSFVLGIAADLPREASRIAVVQSVRLLALTLCVPFLARAVGLEIGQMRLGSGAPMGLGALAVLCGVGATLGLGLAWLRLPAPMLLGPMLISALTHVSGLVPGTVPGWVQIPAFVGLGALIGSRFAGLGWGAFTSALGAGLAVTLIGGGVALALALPAAVWLTMPAAHVLAGFAPGGLETMIALGVVMGASPGFIAACHMLRLGYLTVLIPLALRLLPPEGSDANIPK